MKTISIITLTALAGLFFAFKTPEKNEWNLDKAHAKLGFTVSHLMVSDVDGSFKKFEAKIITTKDDFSDAVATMTAEVSSIDTDNDKRDEDLRSSNYFDAAKYPTITFTSKTFKKINDQNYAVTGDMTIHGVTKTVALNAFCRMGTNPMDKKIIIAGFKVTGKIKRKDFGIAPNTANAMIGDEVALVANVEFIKNESAKTLSQE